MTIGEKCKEIRNYLGLSQVQLAKEIGSNDGKKLISRWETGRYKTASKFYTEKIDEILAKVRHIKHHLGSGIRCDFCTDEIDLMKCKLDKKIPRLLCQKCFYAIYS